LDLLNYIQTLTILQLSEKEISLTVDVTPSDLTLAADKHQIEQILLNLISNAADAISSNSDRQVQIKAFIDSRQRPVIQVSDKGCGIPENQLNDIFTPFFTTKDSGTGIGLSLSRQLARMNHASLNVQSEMGVGSTFSVLFDRDRLLVL